MLVDVVHDWSRDWRDIGLGWDGLVKYSETLTVVSTSGSFVEMGSRCGHGRFVRIQ
jgi:hypothetical protein